MKKITLLLVLSFLNLKAWSQNPNYRYHELQDLGTTIEWAISIECTHHFQPLRILDVNLKQNFKLEVGKIYKVDLGLNYGNFGTRYYKVTYAGDAGTDKGDEIDTPPNFGSPINDLCNSLSWKFIRPILLGTNLQEAQNNFCANLTANNIREKVNIKVAEPLISGNVYFMDFGKGANYYLIDGSSVENGDADYDLDPTNSNSIFYPIAFNCQKPDLRAKAISLDNYNDSYRGSKKSLLFTVSQIGSNIKNANTTFTFYLSNTRGIVNPNDVQIATQTWSAQDINYNVSYSGGFSTTVFFTIPSNVSNGNYYITMKITNSEDFNPKNDIITTASSFVVKDGTPPTTTPPTTPTPTPIGKPDLIIDSNNTLVYSDCFDCSPTLTELQGKRHRINNQSGSIRLPLISVKNIGNVISSPTNVRFYLSTDTTFDTADLKSNGNAITINAVSPGESYVVSGGSIFTSDFGNGGTTFTNNWNILMVVDDSKTNTESNENNNITVIPVTFYNPFGKIASAKTEADESTESYSVTVYNFQGQKVLTTEIRNKEEENSVLESFKNDLYIIKSNGETRKIYKK
jgi:hypothetical protein